MTQHDIITSANGKNFTGKITYLSSTYENFIFNECFDKNVLESNGTSIFDGCGIKRAIPMN